VVNTSGLELNVLSEGWDSVIGEYQDYSILGCDTVQLGRISGITVVVMLYSSVEYQYHIGLGCDAV